MFHVVPCVRSQEAGTNEVAMLVEHQVGELARTDLEVGPGGHRDLLVVPLHDIERELEELLVGEVPTQLVDEIVGQLGGLGHERIGQCDGGPLMRLQRVGIGECELCIRLVEALLLGKCRAHRQSGVAVVVAGAAEAHQFRS